jgi:hypothetical protein
VSKVAIVETQKQLIGVVITQSLDVDIITIWIETIVVLNINVVKRGIIIRFVTKLGSGLSVILARHNLSGNKTLSTTIIGVFGTPHMVFTNMIIQIDHWWTQWLQEGIKMHM